ncbi:hypothetical protein BU17DRAFT_101849 [Hysterangium stoloniferum]|nr:hypothetical protein BU17DRAFT_101849 [Hysterangium stoloniferum]
MSCYDYTLTFGLEVDLIWQRKVPTSTILYFMARYLPLGELLFQVAATSATPKNFKLQQ